MQFKSIVAALCAAATLVSATPVAIRAAKPDNTQKIVNHINSISSQLTTLNNTLNTFYPNSVNGVVIALQIKQETDQLAKSLNQTVQLARGSSNFTSDDSNAIATVVINLIDPINSTIGNVVAHKPAFTSVGGVADLSKTVLTTLELQRKLSRQLGVALEAKLAQPYAAFAPQITQQLITIFNKAIRKFQACEGILCLPPIP